MEEEAGLNCKGLFPIKGHLQQKEGGHFLGEQAHYRSRRVKMAEQRAEWRSPR